MILSSRTLLGKNGSRKTLNGISLLLYHGRKELNCNARTIPGINEIPIPYATLQRFCEISWETFGKNNSLLNIRERLRPSQEDLEMKWRRTRDASPPTWRPHPRASTTTSPPRPVKDGTRTRGRTQLTILKPVWVAKTKITLLGKMQKL